MIKRKVALRVFIFIVAVVIVLTYSFGERYLFPKQYVGSLPISFNYPAVWDIEDNPQKQEIILGTKDDPAIMLAVVQLHTYDDTAKSSVEILEDTVPHFFASDDYLYLTAPYRNYDWPPQIVAVQVIYSRHIPMDIFNGVPIIQETQFVIIEGEQQYALMIFATRLDIEDFQEAINLIVSSFRFE